MTAGDWVVLASAAAAIAWVNWYFFFAERSAGSSSRRFKRPSSS